MKTSLINIAILLSISAVMLAGSTGCSTNTQRENTTLGAVSGAVVGGLAGSLIGQGTGQIVAIGVGAIAGALVGGKIGSSMDSTDNVAMQKAMDNKTYRSSAWVNPKTGRRYAVTPTSGVMEYNGNPDCRKFHASARISGHTETTDGIACRQSNGTWRSMN